MTAPETSRKAIEARLDHRRLRHGGNQGGICGIADRRFSGPGRDRAAERRDARLSRLAVEGKGEGWAKAGIVKDAGDDPDVTHGCLVVATVRPGAAGRHVQGGRGGRHGHAAGPADRGRASRPSTRFRADDARGIAELGGRAAMSRSRSPIPGGEKLADKTWNPRLGIVGGLSILGTTGIVHPFSCSAWIASIHRGIDVARAAGLAHVAGCTGSTSEEAVRALYGLPLEAMIDMGDFAGGMLKYLRDHPVPRVTVGGGFGKIMKLAQGAMDLHSGRSQVDFGWLAERLPRMLARDACRPTRHSRCSRLPGKGLTFAKSWRGTWHCVAACCAMRRSRSTS